MDRRREEFEKIARELFPHADFAYRDGYVFAMARKAWGLYRAAQTCMKHWAQRNPGRADQYRAEAKACRKALGFDPEAEDVAPIDLINAIKMLQGADSE